MNRQILACLDRSLVVLRLAEHVHDTPRVPLPTGTDIGAPVACTVRPRLSPSEGPIWAMGAHHAVAQLLLHLERQVHVLELERLVDSGDGFARKLDVDDGADDLGNLSLAGN